MSGVSVSMSGVSNDDESGVSNHDTNHDTSTTRNDIFKLEFKLHEYWLNSYNLKSFFPFAVVVFDTSSSGSDQSSSGSDQSSSSHSQTSGSQTNTHISHYHVPLVITPFSYNTYKGT